LSPEGIRIDGVVRDVRLLELEERKPSEALLELALERGRARGVDEGRQAARDEMLELFERAVQGLEAEREEALAALSRTSIELAIQIARHLLRREVRAENYDLEKLVRQTLEEASVGRGPCVVHLNPVDHARLAGVRFRTGTTVQADDGVSRGDVHVETSLGLMVRETLGTLDAIEKRLLEEHP